MKVLILDEWLPWPLESGKKIRSFNLISRLCFEHEILYLAYIDRAKDYEKIKHFESLGIKVIPVEDLRTKKWTLPFYLEVILSLLTKHPFSTLYHLRPCFIKEMVKAVSNEKPDVVHCEWTNLAPALRYLPPNITKIITAHNVESQIWERFAKSSSSPFVKFIAIQQAKRIEKLEREWYPKVECCIAVSNEDQAVIRSYGANVQVVENGVDLEYYKQRHTRLNGKKVAFTASFDTFSNQDAVDYFVGHILPILEAARPGISYWMVGKDPPSRLRNLSKQHPEINFTGTVSDVREFVMDAAVCMVPLRVGGGSRLKILEALAMKKPVVSTSVGAEGLKTKNGLDILIADKPKQFAEKIIQLIDDPTFQTKIGANGYELVKRLYDWNHLAERQNNIWKSLTKPEDLLIDDG